MKFRTGLLVSAAVAILGGCSGTVLPPGVGRVSRDWAIVSWHGEVFDLENRNAYTLAPYVRSLLGETLFPAFQMPEDPTKLYYALASSDGRFLACKAADERLCMVDLKAARYALVEPPAPAKAVSLGAWNPKKPCLLCYVFSSQGEEFKGHLYLLSYESDRWSWKKLEAAGEVASRRGRTVLTQGAWTDDQGILFVSAGKIYSVGTGGAVPMVLAEGNEAYSFRDGSFICRKESGLQPFVLVRPGRPGEKGMETPLDGDGVTMNSRPALSPDGRYALFVENSIASLFGDAAISYDVCLYDLQALRFHRAIEGFWAGPAVEAVFGAVWVQDPFHMRALAQLRR